MDAKLAVQVGREKLKTSGSETLTQNKEHRIGTGHDHLCPTF